MGLKNLKKLAYAYSYYLFIKHSIDISMICSSSLFFLNNLNKRIKVVYALRSEHTTKKKDNIYTYNIWEVNNLENIDCDFLVVVIFDNLGDEVKEFGIFVLPRDIVLKIRDKKSITFFESDITGNYKKEPKINKHYYFNNFEVLKKYR